MSPQSRLAAAIAAAFLAGRMEEDALVDRGGRLLGKRWRWLRPLAHRVVAEFDGPTRPRVAAVTRFLLADEGYLRATTRHAVRLADLHGAPAEMCPADAALGWSVPAICTVGELAEWLGVSAGDLDWFADLKQFERRHARTELRHYHYRVLAKRYGQVRLIEAPKECLKAIQRRIKADVLDRAPTHEAAHGFVRGRSIRSFARPHTGKRVVLKIDLQDFFPSIAIARVQALFRTMGYPERVADALAGLCANSAPDEVWRRDGLALHGARLHDARRLYARPHLPQGAPTSPSIANLCAYRLDCRLTALAAAAGAVYTRYADDLAFSGDGDFARAVDRVHTHACATIREEGFRIHHRKTRIMRQGGRQRLAGVVVNEHLSVPRADFDRLKATLTNCVRFGADSQNRGGHTDFRAHLQGRVAYVESINPQRGQKLRRLFDQIAW